MIPGRTTADHPSLLELVDATRWQRLQDHFAHVLGIAIRTVNPSHELLVSPSWPAGLVPEQGVELLNIGQELDALLPRRELPQDTSSMTTPLGVTYAAVPIRATPGQAVAYFIVGPMVVGPRENRQGFRQRLSESGLDAQAVWNLILTLRPYTFSGIHSLLSLLEEVGASITQFAYQVSQLSAILPVAANVDQAVVGFYTERVLHSLLEVATMATRAEGGSVMVYEEDGQTLKIKAARGLSDAVVAETRQGPDEGLAGVATRQRAILLIDDQTADAALKPLMRRTELVSSLVAPLTLEPGHRPIGVLNLRTGDRQRRFTSEHVEMLRRLLDLTGIALGNLRFALPKPS